MGIENGLHFKVGCSFKQLPTIHMSYYKHLELCQ